MSHNNRVNLSSIVSRQFPEFVREDYPTFVAFVEAYYEYMQSQEVDLTQIRDIDTTLDSFVQYFKKELAVNLPVVVEDERLLLQHIKDQYLSKGSEGSFKLLFRMLFGKNVQLMYPGHSMLIASDGRWNQEISVFVKVEYGDPNIAVGKLIDIQSGDRILRVLVDRKENLVGEVDRIVALGGDIYEMYLDKRFFGNLNAGDRIKYLDKFQAIILPATSKISVTQPGRNFRVGQVFNLQSGTGTGALMKVTRVTPQGGLVSSELIRFGIGYTADFAVSLLSNNTVTAKYRPVTSSSSVSGDNLFIGDATEGLFEEGFINNSDYVDSSFVDGTYAGTVVRTFTLSSENAQTDPTEPAIIQVNLGALNRYPGYFESNNGFPSDSIYIQDSKYYQTFSYVLRIDERLNTYKSAVKTMVHPAGMRLFGEYDVSNTFNLELALESLVKSLGIGLEDYIDEYQEIFTLEFDKVVSDEFLQDDNLIYSTIYKSLTESEVGTITDSHTLLVSKSLQETSVGDFQESTTKEFGKNVTEVSVGNLEELTSFDISKRLDDIPIISESYEAVVAKYIDDQDATVSLSEDGKIWINPYQGQDYFAETYAEGLEQTF